MAMTNVYEQYNKSKVLTATPAELTLMLYEGAIKFCNIAIAGIEQKNVPKAHKNIIKVENIVEHLRITLDEKYPVSEEFDRIYLYLSKRLVEANLSKDKEILEEVCMHLRSVRDMWKEVMRINKEKGAV